MTIQHPLFSLTPDTPKEFSRGFALRLFLRGERIRVQRNCSAGAACAAGCLLGILALAAMWP